MLQLLDHHYKPIIFEKKSREEEGCRDGEYIHEESKGNGGWSCDSYAQDAAPKARRIPATGDFDRFAFTSFWFSLNCRTLKERNIASLNSLCWQS